MTDENYVHRIYDLMDQAAELPTCDQKMALLEQAISLADSHGNRDLGYEVRQDLIHDAAFGGYPQKMLVAFAWCLAQCDRDPEQFSEWDILWKYKWSANRLTDFPEISRQQIDETLDDMSQRYERFGAGQRAVLKLRYRIAWDFGDHDQALEYHKQWVKAPRDNLTDCPACERNHDVEYYIRTKEYAKALQHAKPILNGQLSCAEVPHNTYAQLLLPAFELEKFDTALDFHRRGYQLIRGQREHISDACDHIFFLLRIDQLDAALEIVQTVAPMGFAANDSDNHFEFRRVLRCCVQRARATGLKALRINFPSEVPGGPQAYDLDTFDAWNQEHLDDLVRRFNQRNGNEYYSQLVEQADRWMTAIKPFPLD